MWPGLLIICDLLVNYQCPISPSKHEINTYLIHYLQLFITHTVGFLITVWILKKYAWGPLLNLLEERRNKIVDEFQKIEEGKADIEKQAAEYDARLRDIENERRVKLTEAVNEGKQIAEEIKTAAHNDAKQIAAKAQAELDRDVAKAKVELKNDMVDMTVSAASKIINEKLDDDKHRDLIGKFIDEVEKV